MLVFDFHLCIIIITKLSYISRVSRFEIGDLIIKIMTEEFPLIIVTVHSQEYPSNPTVSFYLASISAEYNLYDFMKYFIIFYF